MAWKKSSEGLKAIFNTALPADPRVERRPLFGAESILWFGIRSPAGGGTSGAGHLCSCISLAGFGGLGLPH